MPISPARELLGWIEVGEKLTTFVAKQSSDGKLEIVMQELQQTHKVIDQNLEDYPLPVLKRLVATQKQLFAEYEALRDEPDKSRPTFFINLKAFTRNSKARDLVANTDKHKKNTATATNSIRHKNLEERAEARSNSQSGSRSATPPMSYSTTLSTDVRQSTGPAAGGGVPPTSSPVWETPTVTSKMPNYAPCTVGPTFVVPSQTQAAPPGISVSNCNVTVIQAVGVGNEPVNLGLFCSAAQTAVQSFGGQTAWPQGSTSGLSSPAPPAAPTVSGSPSENQPSAFQKSSEMVDLLDKELQGVKLAEELVRDDGGAAPQGGDSDAAQAGADQ